MAFDLKQFKLNWKGRWKDRTVYKKNDVVFWKGKPYRCIQDTPLAYTMTVNPEVNTSNYSFFPPRLRQRTYRPDNSKYWALFMHSTDDVEHWQMWRQYEPGEICTVGRKMYQCIKRTRHNNTWVEEHDGRDSEYWTLIYEAPFGYPDRNKGVSVDNRAPLGWKYNMGRNDREQIHSYSLNVITPHGDSLVCFGNNNNGKNGLGDGQSGNSRRNHHFEAGFSNIDWLLSTDNKNLVQTEHTGRMVTPDGKTPRVIQTVTTNNNCMVLFNNGEVYMAGDDGNFGLGYNTTNTSTADRNYYVRCTANELTDWQGNTIPKSFNQTKMVKVGSSGQGQNNETNSYFALGEDGSVWVWGYNNNGQLGLGNPTINNSTDTTGGNINRPFYSGNIQRPVRLPQSYFSNKKIVDIWCNGCEEAYWHAMDEDGWLWAWGQDLYGCLGVGSTNHASEGTYYYTVPTRVKIDWNNYGGIKMLQHWAYDSQSQAGTWILTGDGYLWYTGYFTNGQVPGFYGLGDNSTRYTGEFRRPDFHLNGDVEEFWCGGDEHKWIAFRQKTTGMAWYNDGNYGTYGTRGTRVQQGYWYNSGGIHGVFTHLQGPKYLKHVSGMNSNRGDGSYIYDSPGFMDDNGDIWQGNAYNYQHWPHGGSQNPDQHSNGYRNMITAGWEDNSDNRHRKRRLITPSGGHRTTDMAVFGFPTALNVYFQDQHGKIMASGHTPNNQTYLYDLMPYRYYTQTLSSWGDNNDQAFMTSFPGD